MQDITTVSALESIDFTLLGLVSGGCGGGKRRCCPQPQAAPVQQVQVLQLPAVPTQLPPAPASVPTEPPAPSTGDSVSTSVRIG